jgi:hypothetical protein
MLAADARFMSIDLCDCQRPVAVAVALEAEILVLRQQINVVCTENPICVDDVMESPKLAE